jgi:hypothetical protein
VFARSDARGTHNLNPTAPPALFPDKEGVSIRFSATSVSPSANLLHGQVAVGLTMASKEHLLPAASGQPLATCAGTSCAATTAATGVRLTVLALATPTGVDQISIPTTFDLAALIDGDLVQDIAIPISGNADAFPFDTYAVTLAFSLPPSNLGLPSSPQSSFLSPDTLDGLQANGHFTDTDPNTAVIDLGRPVPTIAAISLTGLLYPALILFVLLMLAPTNHNAGALTREILLATATLALTFLPLRQLFVPSSITGVTRLDWTLIFALFAIVLALVIDSRFHRSGRKAHVTARPISEAPAPTDPY